MEKLQSGKRLTFDEFILAQRTFGDDKKRSKKRGKGSSEEVKAEPEPVESIEPDSETESESGNVGIDEELEEITAGPPEESKED